MKFDGQLLTHGHMDELPARRRLREKREREARERAAAEAGGAPVAARSPGDDVEDEVKGADAPAEFDDYERDEYDDEDDARAASRSPRREPTSDDGYSTTSNAAEANQDAWKTFGTETEAGRLLKRLYGDNTKPTIKYPKVRTAPRGPVPAFVPGGGKHDVDARKPKAKAKKMTRVRVTGGYEPRKLTMIEYSEMCGGRRKRGKAIEAELKQRQEENDRYRPLAGKAKSTPLEKQRLQNINMFKGGKVLPDELTLAPIKGEIPLSMMTDPRAKKKFVPKRKKAAAAAPVSPVRSDAEVLFDRVSAEIDERMDFLAKMRKLSRAEAKKHEGIIRGEIAQRTLELERLHAIIQAEKKENTA